MDSKNHRHRLLARAVAVWLVIILAEILHGIARGLLLVPLVGEFRSSQIGVFTGSLIILATVPVFLSPDVVDWRWQVFTLVSVATMT